MEKETDIKQVISHILKLLFNSDQKEALEKALEYLLSFLQADWIYIAAFDETEESTNILFKSQAAWLNSVAEEIPPILPFNMFPWMVATIKAGQNVILDDVNDFPAEAEKDKLFFKKQGYVSMLVLPLTFQDKVQGFIGFDFIQYKKHWSLPEVEDLQIIANMFSIILERQQTRQEAQEEKRKSKLELEKVREADRLKSAFLANMSHEIRTPLNAIVGFSDLIAETEEDSEKEQYREIIHKNNELLLQLISDILDFSKIEAGTLTFEYSDINIKELCSEIALIFSSRDSSEVQFIFREKEHPDVVIHTDAQRLMQVIMNIISNAYKFTENGSITLAYKVTENSIHISVSDTGIGIDPKDHAQVFERFVKVNNFSQGTGLGLTICKTIIESLNGQINLISSLGSGSTFIISLPVSRS